MDLTQRNFTRSELQSETINRVGVQSTSCIAGRIKISAKVLKERVCGGGDHSTRVIG